MRGVILAGGKGTRLYPLTKVVNKHLLPVFDSFMVEYPLRLLVDCGITEVCIVTGPEHAGQFCETLSDGHEYGCNISYAVQPEAGGIPQALACAEPFAGNDSVLVILGDNLLRTPCPPIKNYVRNVVTAERTGWNTVCATIFTKQVDDPTAYGVAVGAERGRVTALVEKPLTPVGTHAIIGVYAFPKSVWRHIRKLQPSARGELEITNLCETYLHAGSLNVVNLGDELWLDAGCSLDGLLAAAIHVRGWKDV